MTIFYKVIFYQHTTTSSYFHKSLGGHELWMHSSSGDISYNTCILLRSYQPSPSQYRDRPAPFPGFTLLTSPCEYLFITGSTGNLLGCYLALSRVIIIHCSILLYFLSLYSRITVISLLPYNAGLYFTMTRG